MLHRISAVFWGLTLLCSFAGADQGFYRISDVEFKSPAIASAVEKVSRASVRFHPMSGKYISQEELEGKTPLQPHCSGQFISNDGYLLTAAHCLKYIVSNTFYAAAMGASRKMDETAKNAWIDFKQQSFSDLFLDDVVIGFNSGAVYHGRAKIVFLGKGYFEVLLKIAALDQKTIHTYSQDFAILKIDRKTECVKLADTEPEDKSPVIGIGFPGPVFRLNLYSSQGISQYFNYGNIVNNVPDFLASFKGHFDPEEHYEHYYHSQVMLASTVDATHGSSGGMIIDSDGNLLGVTVVTMSQYFAGQGLDDSLTGSVRADFIYKQTKKHLGRTKAQEIFNCEAN